MMHDRRPEVKSVDAVDTFEGEPLKKTILAGEVLKKTRMCTGTATAARKKSERRNAWECRLLEIEEVPSGNNENAIK